MFRKMPFVLIAVILGVVIAGPWMTPWFKQLFYAVSMSIKSVIAFILPLVIFTLLFKACITLSRGATRAIAVIIIGVCLSNFLSTFVSRYIGQWIFSFDLSMIAPKAQSSGLSPLWSWSLPSLIANDKAMIGGVILGLLGSHVAYDPAKRLAIFLEVVVNKLLQFVVYLIPLFVLGFVVKLQSDGVVTMILHDYPMIFLVIGVTTFWYIFSWYFVLIGRDLGNSGGEIRKSVRFFCLRSFSQNIKNMIPAAISGFTTMSSAASIPLTIIGVQKNSVDQDLACCTIPATVNIHLVGDCFAIPILAYAVLKSYGIPDPSLMTYLVFSFYFVLAKFSVAAIPGGGILVMLPILEKHLGFNADMMSLITALYILFDPVITCANVLGNGVFANVIDRLVGKKPVNTANPSFKCCSSND